MGPRVRSTTLPVQSELSLGAVSVMRNDLSDSDLEVVESIKPVLREHAAQKELATVN